MSINTQPLKGIIVPMATPLFSNGDFDKKGTERLIRHLLNGGIHGIFVLGTTGEAASLKPSIKKTLISTTCDFVNGKVPVLVGISHTCMEISIKLAYHAKEAGAQAVVAITPYFFPMDQADLLAYYETLASACPLPLYLYNFPAMTKCNLEPDTVLQLAQHPNIHGVKDSSGNGVYFQKLLAVKTSRPEFSVLAGPDEMLAQALLVGADGGVNGGGNIFPSLYAKLYEAAVNRDMETVQKLQDWVISISDKIYNCSPKSSGYISGVKESLYHLGICEPHLSPPLQPIDKSAKENIRQNLEKLIYGIKNL
jgi:2-dehydro-3-deoxy-D-pentonate aldolase